MGMRILYFIWRRIQHRRAKKYSSRRHEWMEIVVSDYIVKIEDTRRRARLLSSKGADAATTTG